MVTVQTPDAANAPYRHVVTVVGPDIHLVVRGWADKAFAFVDIFLADDDDDDMDRSME